jgi:hypothetical protein
MYTTVSTRLYVKQDDAPEYSQPVDVAGANAVMMDVTVFNLQITTQGQFWQLELEGSNDLQNWVSLDSSNLIDLSDTDVMGYFTSDPFHIAASTAYARIKFKTTSTTSGDFMIVNAGLNVFEE